MTLLVIKTRVLLLTVLFLIGVGSQVASGVLGFAEQGIADMYDYAELMSERLRPFDLLRTGGM